MKWIGAQRDDVATLRCCDVVMLRLYAICIYLFLYCPIGVIALFSFNAGRHASQLQGFSTELYGKALSNPFVMDALTTSLMVAFVLAALATVFGTMAAIALQGVSGTLRNLFDLLIYVAVMIPGIVVGIATLIGLVTLFDRLNPVIAALWSDAGIAPQLHLGLGSLISAHTMFLTALVINMVRSRLSGMDRTVIEASADLYATPFGTFRQVTLPIIAPAVVAGFLLSFTFSFDDFIVMLIAAQFLLQRGRRRI